jgi:endoglucanase
MKSMRSSNPYYTHSRGVKTRRFPSQIKIRGMYTVAAFIIMTLSFASVVTAKTEGDKLTSKNNHKQVASRVSARGKVGVSSPPGVTAASAAALLKANRGILANGQQIIPGVIPPKPSWVTMPLYTDPMNGAAQYIANNPSANGAKYISRMSQVPVAQWFGDWNTNVKNDVNSYVSAAASKSSVPVVVVYNIPDRDCGGYSVGGANGVSTYTQWVAQVAAGIGNRPAVIILEPDALGALDCLPDSAQQDRIQSLSQAVTILKAHPQTAVYIDAGTPVWQSTTTMAARLKAANVAAADGFSLNVSYFASTPQNRTYGDQLSGLIGYKHYVIDTSRNGGNHAVTGMQCNPSFASFGEAPTTNTNSSLNDALLWIKIPWESDGPCNGSPGPGQEYWDYAIQLAQNAGW